MGHKKLGVTLAALSIVFAMFGAAPASASQSVFTGSVDAAGTSWRSHKIAVQEDSWMTATLDWDDPSANLNLFLKDPSGVIVAMQTGTAKPEVIEYHTATPGTWTLGVKAKLGSANYTLTVDIVPAGPTGSIGDLVWEDIDGDGLQDAGEPGLQGASVVLIDAASGAEVATATTDASGVYSFPSVSAGDYRLRFDLPPSYVLSPQDQGTDDTLDSDPDPTSRETAVFTVTGGTADLTRDAGAVVTSATVFTESVDSAGTSWRSHKIDVQEDSWMTATLDWDDPAANLNLFLKDPSGVLVAMRTGTAKPEVIDYHTATAGKWTLGVKAKSGSANYTLTVTLDPVGGGGGPTTPSYVRTVGGIGHSEMYPSGLDLDDAGNVYVADTGNDRVTAYTASGTLLWEQGQRIAKQAGTFSNPRDVAYLGGKVYVADTGYNRIQVLDAATGQPLAVWPYHFTSIMGISAGVDGAGSPIILAAASVANEIRIYTPSGGFLRAVGTGPGSGDGQLDGPRDAATDESGNIYVPDYRNHRVAIFYASGAWSGSWGTKGTADGEMKYPYGIDLDDAGDVYVASNSDRIQKFSSVGTFIARWGSAGNGPGQFSTLRRVAVERGTNGRVYGADLWAFKIERFDQQAGWDATFGGTLPAEGLFNEPYGLTVRPDMTIVADTTNQRMERFDAAGAFEFSWGDRGWGADDLLGFNWPRDVTFNTKTNKVWVADTKNNRIIEFTPNGVPTGKTHGKRGSGPTDLHWPYGITSYDSDVIIADTWNGRVMRWDVGGSTPVVVWTATGLNYPKDVTVLGSTVYVADTLNKQVVLLDAATGSVLATYKPAGLGSLEGIAVSPSGNMWVSDTAHRLSELNSSGQIVQQFGSFGSGHGEFNRPGHLETLDDGSGLYLFVVDMWNDRVEVFQLGP